MKSVLSIQSSVTFGAVGNTMASTVLLKLGCHLARIDTVQLAAHPGHNVRAGLQERSGGSMPDQDFKALLAAITALGFGNGLDAIMTGYIGKAAQIDPIVEAITSLKRDVDHIAVMIDPAIGDHGRLYVDDDIALGIEEKLIPLAHIITPNAYEFTRLTGLAQTTPDAIEDAGHLLFDRYPDLKGIAVTGCREHIRDSETTVTDYWIDRDGMTSHAAAPLTPDSRGMAGGGDLFAALLMGYYLSYANWRSAFEQAAKISRHIINGADKADAIDIDLDLLNDVIGRD